ncbi:S41 family peptidase [Roseimarinus sediminis]|jgi:carboxyl-terminal processing protease|uniref:S41 family peptidase n=1 Tax=Roseimarinus sediminis TaxID=1610899 RepID=UPI003D19893B
MKLFIKSFLAMTLLLMGYNVSAQDVQNQSFKFNRMLQLIDNYYVDSTDMEKLTEAAIINMLSELDPHSVYISKEEVEKMNEPLQGSFDGIGISFSILRDTLMVVQTIPGGPSEKVGLQAGDRILFIDDELVAGVGLTNQMVFDRLRGKKGTLVSVKIMRKDEKGLLEFEIIRDKIPIYSLDASYMLNKQTGYIKLNRFSATTTQEFLSAIRELKKENEMENLVLDLRGNGGGYLKSAYEISDQFLDANKLIVFTEGLKNPKKEYKATYNGEFLKGRVVVLIDGGSASASEIVSGAVQDWDRGIIIGRRSFGKGLVQQPYYLGDGSMVRLTTAYYYTPSGRCIQKPYEAGSDDYRNDYAERLAHGELFNKDSIAVNDSLIYTTLISKRNVYGGGGVIPDVFIPLDTSANYAYYNQLLRRSVVNQFVIDYVDSHRDEMKKTYTTFKAFNEQFEIGDDLLEALWEAGDKKGIERNEASIEFIGSHAKRHLKAIIARDLWNSSEYYEVVNGDDDEIIKALELLNQPAKYEAILKGRVNE